MGSIISRDGSSSIHHNQHNSVGGGIVGGEDDPTSIGEGAVVVPEYYLPPWTLDNPEDPWLGLWEMWGLWREFLHPSRNFQEELYDAINKNDTKTIHDLVRHHSDLIDRPCYNRQGNRHNNNDARVYPLFHAIHPLSKLPIIFLLLSQKRKTNSQNLLGQTALHLACSWSTTEVAAFLLEQCKPCLSVPDNEGRLPFHCACRNPILEPELVKRIGQLHPPALTTLTRQYESPTYILAQELYESYLDSSRSESYPLLIHLLEAWPVAACVAAIDDSLDRPRGVLLFELLDFPEIDPELLRQVAIVTLNVFVAMMELILLDETASKFSTNDQIMLRETLADVLVGIDGLPPLTLEDVRMASPATLVQWIVARQVLSLVRRIAQLFHSQPPWCDAVRKDPDFVELLHTWYEINRAGRLDILLDPQYGPNASNWDRNGCTALISPSISVTSRHQNVDSNVMQKILAIAANRHVGATFLLLREMPMLYFPSGGPAGRTPSNKPRTGLRLAMRQFFSHLFFPTFHPSKRVQE